MKRCVNCLNSHLEAGKEPCETCLAFGDYRFWSPKMAKIKRGELVKQAKELFEETAMAQTYPEYVPVPEGELAKRYRERKEAQE